jgi:PIN domain
MNKIRRRTPPPHIVMCDTNILWHEDKARVVNPVFDDFWQKHSEAFPMKLIVPDVVRGELLFQQTTSACKSLTKANNLFEELSRVTEKKYSHRATEEKIRKHVAERFERWLDSKQAELKQPPLSEIDWPELIRCAIWRKPPFTFDSQAPRNEKGFRDALILETVAAICKESTGQESIAFICADTLLRKASEERLGAVKHLTVYESLLEFESFIQLTQQNLTDEFVKGILSRARAKFFTRHNRESLFYKADLHRVLLEKYKKQLEAPSEFAFVISIPGQNVSPIWQRVAGEPCSIGRPEFVKVIQPNEYHWSAKVTFSRLFERAGSWPSIEETEYKKVVLAINVEWKATVRNDGRFFDCTVIGDDIANLSTESPTEEDFELFDVQKKAQQTVKE